MSPRISPPLKLGGGRVRVYGREVGQVTDPTMRMTQQKIEHSTNYALRYRKDAKLAIMEAVELSWVFQHITPFNANILVGMPGWSGVPADRRLGGIRQSLDITGGNPYPINSTEYAVLTDGPDSLPEFASLQYRLYSHSAFGVGLPSIFAINTEIPAAIVGYRGIVADLALTAGDHTMPSDIYVVPVYNAATDDIDVTVQWDTSGITPTLVSIYMFTYTFNNTYQVYVGTYSAANAKLFEDTITAPEKAAGILTRTITSTMVGLTTEAGFPVVPMTVTDNETGSALDWITDFEFTSNFQAGSGIKRVIGGDIDADGVVKVVYTWDGSQAAEMPVGNSDSGSPVVPITIDSMFHDKESKIFIHCWAVEVVNDFQFAFNANDWMGLNFTGEALDRENAYPNFPFGYIQFYGPIAERIKKNGNIPFGQGIPGFELGNKQTTWS